MRGGRLSPGAGVRGFTVIELLIVVAIIGMLAAAAIPVYGHILQRSQRAAFASDARVVYDALMHYYSDKGSFPPEFSPRERAFSVTTLSPLTTDAYLNSGAARGFLAKQFRGRILFYWAPDSDGTDSDVLMLLRPAAAPTEIVGIFSTRSFFFDGDGNPMDGVYFLDGSKWVKVDEVRP